jgi:hypothetical protein
VTSIYAYGDGDGDGPLLNLIRKEAAGGREDCADQMGGITEGYCVGAVVYGFCSLLGNEGGEGRERIETLLCGSIGI